VSAILVRSLLLFWGPLIPVYILLCLT
jgi:hypothetical protein